MVAFGGNTANNFTADGQTKDSSASSENNLKLGAMTGKTM